jgi:AmmeMemoRadiSam system protein A
MKEPLLSLAARSALLGLARRAIESGLSGTPLLPPVDLAAELQRPAGAFVTLRETANGDLRGCVGFTEPRFPLWRTVMEAAVAAALHDSRFPRVALRELAGLSIQVTVLGALAPIAPDAVEIGVHGLVVRKGSRSGLLLPQVAPEHGWDREELLAHTCGKAGLPQDAWRLPGCDLLAFTAEYFGE